MEKLREYPPRQEGIGECRSGMNHGACRGCVPERTKMNEIIFSIGWVDTIPNE